MPSIHVCPLHLVQDEMERLNPSALMTLLAPDGTTLPTPATLTADRHLRRMFHDIVIDRPPLRAPSYQDIAAILDFVTAWDQDRPLLIHCFAGISRSTAAAFITACTLAPGADETMLAARLRMASPSATPNSRMVALADDLMGRNGRMVRAVDKIGRGADAACGEPFELQRP